MKAYLWTMAVLFAMRVLSLLKEVPGHQDKPVTAGTLFAARLITLALLTWTVVLLTGCGGGDAADDEDRSVPTPPVNCHVTPELCK